MQYFVLPSMKRKKKEENTKPNAINADSKIFWCKAFLL